MPQDAAGAGAGDSIGGTSDRATCHVNWMSYVPLRLNIPNALQTFRCIYSTGPSALIGLVSFLNVITIFKSSLLFLIKTVVQTTVYCTAFAVHVGTLGIFAYS